MSSTTAEMTTGMALSLWKSSVHRPALSLQKRWYHSEQVGAAEGDLAHRNEDQLCVSNFGFQSIIFSNSNRPSMTVFRALSLGYSVSMSMVSVDVAHAPPAPSTDILDTPQGRSTSETLWTEGGSGGHRG